MTQENLNVRVERINKLATLMVGQIKEVQGVKEGDIAAAVAILGAFVIDRSVTLNKQNPARSLELLVSLMAHYSNEISVEGIEMKRVHEEGVTIQ